MTFFTRLALACVTAAALAGCSRLDPIGTDLATLNRTARQAMESADVQAAMNKVQAAATPQEKAQILRASSDAIDAARATLQKAELRSDEVRRIQARMVAGFGQLGEGARTAAGAFEQSATAELDKARAQMRDGQVEFIAAGQEMVRLARERSVDLKPGS